MNHSPGRQGLLGFVCVVALANAACGGDIDERADQTPTTQISTSETTSAEVDSTQPNPGGDRPDRDAALIGWTTSFSKCVGFCESRLSLDDAEVTLTFSTDGGLDHSVAGTLTRAGVQTFHTTSAALTEAQLPAVQGCPDCADRGAASLILHTTNGALEEHHFEFAQLPEEVKAVEFTVGDLYRAMTYCETSPLLELAEGCVPLGEVDNGTSTDLGVSSSGARVFIARYDAGAFLLNESGEVQRWLPGAPKPSVFDSKSFGVAEEVLDRVLPEDCRWGRHVLGRITALCRDPDGVQSPTVVAFDLAVAADEGGEAAIGEGSLIARLPEPPEELAGARVFFGGFRDIFPRGQDLTDSVAQLSAECEQPVAVRITNGVATHWDGSDYWEDESPAGGSHALGWIGDDFVIELVGGCGEDDQPIVYRVSENFEPSFMFERPPGASEVQLLDEAAVDLLMS